MTALARSFYARATMLVARDLLGKVLVHTLDGQRYAGRIVETEGYVGPDDAASHARSGQKGRAALMWGPAGVAYVYLIYGMHHCFNAVTETEGYPGAVLVRAVEPLAAASEHKANGPALVCRALRIDRSCSGLDLTTCDSGLAIEEAPAVPDTEVRMGRRIGVDYAGAWAAHPWRVWLADSPAVSRKRGQSQQYDASLVLA
jgi:DNA-3-methyladenine glycosylase